MADMRHQQDHQHEGHKTDECGMQEQHQTRPMAGGPKMGIGTGAAAGCGHGQLQRSGSGSSSSSEDDGQGGRRKKGLKEKIKEKLPGAHKTAETGHEGCGGAETRLPAAYGGEEHQEKKGMMEKIKEKLPGHN